MPQHRLWSALVAGVLFASSIVGTAWRVEAGSLDQGAGPEAGETPTPGDRDVVRVPCEDVLHESTDQIDILKGHPLDLSVIAKKLGTSVPWVTLCLETYGRLPDRPLYQSVEERSTESLEDQEPAPTPGEDIEENGPRLPKAFSDVPPPLGEKPPPPEKHPDEDDE